MPFHMYCDCGSGMHEVVAHRLNDPRAGRVGNVKSFGKVNRCSECGKTYPAVPSRGPRPDRKQMSFHF